MIINCAIININNILYNEINRYKKNLKSPSYEPNYGIILRSHNFNKTGAYSNILLESNLMSKIRNLIYNHSFTKKLNLYKQFAKFEEGGEYDLDDNQIQDILANGGQIEYL